MAYTRTGIKLAQLITQSGGLCVAACGCCSTFEPLDHHWVQTFLLANPRATRHFFGDDNRVTFTGSTADVKEFVRAHAGEPAAFDEPLVLTRVAR